MSSILDYLPKGWTQTSIGSIRSDDTSAVDPITAPDESFDLYSIPAHDQKTFEHVFGKEIGSSKKLLTPGTVLLSKLNPRINRVGIVGASRGYRQVGSSEWIPFSPVPGVDSTFLAYFLRQESVRAHLAANVSGVGGSLTRTNSSIVDAIPLPIPPLEEQNRIAENLESLLSRLDSAVENLEGAQAKLKAYRASVLKAAVEGLLVPTEAELARAENRDYEPADVLLKRILVECRRRWEEGEIAKMNAAAKPPKDEHWKSKYVEPMASDAGDSENLPEGWAWATIDGLSLRVMYGSSAKTSSANSDGVAVLRMGNIVDGSLNLQELKYLPHGHNEFPELLLRNGDLLFNRTNSAELVGKSAVYKGRPPVCSYASYLIKVELSEGCNSDWVAYVLNSHFGRQWIASVVSQQVGQANVNGSKLKALVIPLPPSAEQERIVSVVEEIFSTQEATINTIRLARARCARLRQSILKWAFEGKLVDQNSSDEPSEKLLERIRAERASKTTGKKTQSRRKVKAVR